MRGGRTITKNLLTLLFLAITVFGVFSSYAQTALAYNTNDKAIDREYLTGTPPTHNDVPWNTKKLSRINELIDYGNTSAANTNKLRAMLAEMNAMKNKIQGADCSKYQDQAKCNQFKADAWNRLQEVQKTYDEVLKTHRSILGWVKDGKALVASLYQADNTNTTNCYTSAATGSYTDDMTKETYQHCSDVFVKQYLLPAKSAVPSTDKLFVVEPKYNEVKAMLEELGGELTDQDKAEAQKTAQNEVPNSALESCVSGFIDVNVGVCVREFIGWIIYVIVIIIAGLLSLAGMLLNATIDYTVVHITQHLDELSAINNIWVVLRDFANLGFLFIMLYVAVGTILQLNGVNWKKTLVQIILAAILINFSLFITKIVIDISNIIALAFYNAVGGKDLSNTFMDMLGLSSIFKDASDNVQVWAQSWSTLVGMGLGTAVVFFITAFSFFAAAWLFMFRYVMIIMLLVISPLAFAARAFPKMEKQWSQWWTSVMSQAIFPVIYMTFIWITVKVGKELFSKGGGSLQKAFSVGVSKEPDTSLLPLIIKFVIVIVLLNYALILAKSQASKVGYGMGDYMKKGLGYVDNFRNHIKSTSAGVAQRNLINRPGRTLRKAYNRQAAIIADKGITKWAGGVARNTVGAAGAVTGAVGLNYVGRKIANTSVVQNKVTKVKKYARRQAIIAKMHARDFANTRFAKKVAKGAGYTAKAAKFVGSKTGLTAVGKGAISLGGYMKEAAAIGIDRSINEHLGQIENKKLVKGSENLGEYEKYTKGRVTELKNIKKSEEDKAKIEAGLGIKLEELAGADESLIDNLETFTKTVKDLTSRQVEEQKGSTFENPAFMAALSHSQYDTFTKSDKFKALNETEQQKIKDARKKGLKDWAEKNSASFEKIKLKGIKPSDVAEMPLDALKVMAKNGMVDGAALDQIVTKGNMGYEDRAAIRKEISESYNTLLPEIETALDEAKEAAINTYVSTHTGKTRADAISALKLDKDETIEKLTIRPEHVGGDEAKAKQLERIRKAVSYLGGGKGNSF